MEARLPSMPMRLNFQNDQQSKGDKMLQDVIEGMPSWIKGGIAIGVGIMVGVLTAQVVMAIGI